MKSLKTLIRLHRNELDEKRRHLAEMQRRLDALQQALATHDAEVEREKEMARHDLDAAMAFPRFHKAASLRREKLVADLVEAERMVEAAREEVASAFQEVKRFEITEENRIERERRHEAQLEQVRLDEVALNQHRRREA